MNNAISVNNGDSRHEIKIENGKMGSTGALNQKHDQDMRKASNLNMDSFLPRKELPTVLPESGNGMPSAEQK